MNNYKTAAASLGLLVLAALFGAGTVLGFESAGEKLAKKHVGFGNTAMENADYERAVEHYESALKANPEDKKIIYSLGVLYLQTGQSAKAIPLFTRYLELFPMDRDGVIALSQAYILEGDYDKTVRLLKQVEKPGEAVRRNLGYAQLQLGEIESAVRTLEDLVADFPSNRLSRLDLGCAYAAGGDLDKGLKSIRSGLDMFPDAEGRMIYQDLLNERAGGELDKAVALFNASDMQGAKEILAKLTSTYPDYARAWMFLAHACNYALPSDREGAKKAYEAALKAQRYVPVGKDDLAVIHDNLGTILLREGNLKEAEAHYRQAISQETKYALPYFNYGLLRANAGASTEASLAFMDAVRRDKSMADYLKAHPKLAKFRHTADYTNILNTIEKELK